MKKHIALGVAAVLGLGTLALATPANAVEPEPPTYEACTVDETHTELTWELQETHWVSGPTPATIVEGWYTESDDEAPVASDTGITFTADGTQATGLRTAASGEFADVTGPTLGLDPNDPLFHERLVIDVEGEPFTGAQAWRNDYLSVNFVPGGVYVNTPASGWQTLSLADAQALFPGADVTSIGFHLDSNAPEGEVRFVDGYVVPAQPEVYSDWAVVSTGQSTALPNGQQDGVQFYDNGWYRYVVTGSVEVTEQVEGECLVLPAPVQVDECGTDNDTIIVPEIEGVFYGVYDYIGADGSGWEGGPDGYDWQPGDAWVVIATQDNWRPFDEPIAPQGDYALDTAGSPGWWFPNFTDVPCEVTPTEPPATVTPAANITPTASSLADTGVDNGVLIGTFAAALIALVGGAFALTVWHIRRRDAHKQ